jgi:hypothetical protein
VRELVDSLARCREWAIVAEVDFAWSDEAGEAALRAVADWPVRTAVSGRTLRFVLSDVGC